MWCAGHVLALVLLAQGAPTDTEPLDAQAAEKDLLGRLQPNYGGFRVGESEFGSSRR
jgi:hypothetical protein